MWSRLWLAHAGCAARDCAVFLRECARKREMQWRHGRCYERFSDKCACGRLSVIGQAVHGVYMGMVPISHGRYWGWLASRAELSQNFASLRTQVVRSKRDEKSGVQGRVEGTRWVTLSTLTAI